MNIWCERGANISKNIRKRLETFDPNKIKKITIIRHAALGDMIITRAVLIEMKKFFPNAKITLSLVDKYLYGKPKDLYDEEHIVYRKKGFLNRFKCIKSLEKQDIIFDFAGTSISRNICAFNKADLKIGFPYREIEHKLLYDISVFRSDFHFEGEIMLDALKILGHQPQYPLEYNLPKCKGTGKKIVYFFGASTETKQYPKNMYYKLIEELSEEFIDYEHILLEGIKKDEKFDDISDVLVNKKNIKIQKTLNLDELIEFLANCRLCVSPDTGVRNVAIATHTPTLGIFYSTVPYRYWPTYENAHDIVFVRNGEIPNIKQVKDIISKNLEMKVVR